MVYPAKIIMKHWKKVLSVLLVVFLVFAMSLPAFAAQSKKQHTIKASVSANTAAKRITISGSDVVAKGKSVKLKASVAPNGASQKVTWETSNKKIATVSSKGVVTGKKAGTVTITAVSKTNPKIKKTWEMTVTAKPVKKIEIIAPQTEIDLSKKKTVMLKVKVSPSKACEDVTWKSSNTKVAKISAKGKLTVLSKGSTKITAEAVDGSGVKATLKVTVIDSSETQEPQVPQLPTSLNVNIKSHEGNQYTFSMNFPGLQKTYRVSKPETPINRMDFKIGFSVACGEVTYEISTSHFKFDDTVQDLTLYDMQSDIWEMAGNSASSIGRAVLDISGTVICWTVTFPDGFDASNAKIVEAQYLIDGESLWYTLNKPF